MIVHRSLHVYDYVANKLLFKTNIPNSQQSAGISSHSNKSLYFADDDQVIVVRDGSSRLVLVSISQQIEMFQKTIGKVKTDDMTLQIETNKQFGENNIDIGFKRLVLDQDSDRGASLDGDKDDSDGQIEEMKGKTYLEYDGVIQKLAFSRVFNDYEYIAILSD